MYGFFSDLSCPRLNLPAQASGCTCRYTMTSETARACTERIGIGPELLQNHRLDDDTFGQVLVFLAKTKQSRSAKSQQSDRCRLRNILKPLDLRLGQYVVVDVHIIEQTLVVFSAAMTHD